MKTVIRRETPEDYKEIHNVVKTAFASAEHSDGDEQELVERLRASSAYLPELALVAEEDGEIVGYLLMTEITVGETAAVTVGPLAVLPCAQGRGIGGALIRAGHEIAKEMGYGFSVLLGHAGYYPRFGYRPASSFGIRTKLNVPDENYMACPLREGASRLEGVVRYPKEWGIE